MPDSLKCSTEIMVVGGGGVGNCRQGVHDTHTNLTWTINCHCNHHKEKGSWNRFEDPTQISAGF